MDFSWSQLACATIFFLIPKNVTSEREAAKCQMPRTGGSGGAERIVWETLLDMERFNYHAGGRDQGAIALVLD